MPIIRAKIRLSIFRSIVFLENRNHIPIIPNIMKTDTKTYDVLRDVVMCSDTESVSESRLVRKGFIALRYLNPGRPTIPLAKTPIIEIIIDMRNMEQFRMCLDSLLNFLINSHTTTKTVERPTRSPA